MADVSNRLAPPRGTVGILDDAPARITAMRRVLLGHAGVAVIDRFDAADFLTWLDAANDVLFLSLDHDLGPSRVTGSERRDPGIGMDVVESLTKLPPRFPIIVHSSNPIDAPRMEFLLAHAGWEVHRVMPHSAERWIDDEWATLVAELLARDLEPSALRANGPRTDDAAARLVERLERLATLHTAGALTDDEFRDAKAAAIHLTDREREPDLREAALPPPPPG